MKPGEHRLLRDRWRTAWKGWRRSACAACAACLACLFVVGCATNRGDLEKKLMMDQKAAFVQPEVAEQYVVSCPDVLDIRIGGYPEYAGDYIVEPDGRIDMGDLGTPRVEGKTVPAIAEQIARECKVNARDVHVRVAEYRSQFVVLIGQVIGWQRVVPYRGQETVLTLLQRVGGITRGAAPEDVFVVRTNLEKGHRPEAFHVDLNAIVMKNDDKTNIRLLPFDQVYVGETRQSRMERIVPPWIRPLYQALWDTRPDPEEAKKARADHFRRISDQSRKIGPRPRRRLRPNTPDDSAAPGVAPAPDASPVPNRLPGLPPSVLPLTPPGMEPAPRLPAPLQAWWAPEFFLKKHPLFWPGRSTFLPGFNDIFHKTSSDESPDETATQLAPQRVDSGNAHPESRSEATLGPNEPDA